jgi:prepilin-type N-terminal cleavage/methylation domain-containing protein
MKEKFKYRQKSYTGGFTLIELLVVSTIIILLAAIGLISYRTAMMNSRNSKRRADLETVRQALVLRRSETGCYPDSSVFDMVVDGLNTDGYLSEGSDRFEDPKSDQSYEYASLSCTAGCCAGFTLTATLEPTELYTLSNP